jgi:hypothetical protein
MAKENIGNVDADDLLKNASSEIDKYMIEKELKYADDFIFCVALFTNILPDTRTFFPHLDNNIPTAIALSSKSSDRKYLVNIRDILK